MTKKETLSEKLSIRVSPSEKKLLRRYAKTEDRSLNTTVRMLIKSLKHLIN